MEAKTFLKRVVEEVKGYRGFTRKACIWDLAKIFNVECRFDDAGWFKVGNHRIVATSDGIAEELTRDDPWLAGFYSVLVNVNDVVAKGAKPVGYIAIISSNSPDVRRKIVEGIKEAIEKYRLKILKLHTHPDSTYDSVDAGLVGVAKKVISSNTAKPKEKLVLVIDMDGDFRKKGWVRCFDTVVNKSANRLRKLLGAIWKAAEKSLVTSSRDISSPGFLGSIAMLCESSRVGAKIDVEKIPKPSNVDWLFWLTSYPSLSFIFSTKKPEKCLAFFRRYGYEANIVGEVTKNKKIVLGYRGEEETLLDLNRESVFGVKRG